KRAFRNVFQPVRGKVYKSPKQKQLEEARRRGQTQRQDKAQNARLQRLRRGSINLSYSRIYLIIIAKALREIRYYQSVAMAESLLIPRRSFERVVKEICHDLKVHEGRGRYFQGHFRWETDALYALQTMTEDILLMVFEMTYFS